MTKVFESARYWISGGNVMVVPPVASHASNNAGTPVLELMDILAACSNLFNPPMVFSTAAGP